MFIEREEDGGGINHVERASRCIARRRELVPVIPRSGETPACTVANYWVAHHYHHSVNICPGRELHSLFGELVFGV